MSGRKTAWLSLGLVAVAALSFTVVTSSSGPETSSERAERLSYGVRCPTCQGLSAAESDAKAATAVRAEITRRVEQGQSDEQIRQALVDRYGEGILLTPEGEGVAALVWALPVAAFVVAGAGLTAVFMRRGRESAALAGASPSIRPATAEAGSEIVAVSDPPADSGRAPLRTAVAVVAVVAVAAAAGVLVARTAGERLPGESATGTVDLGPAELLVEARAILAQGEAVQALRRYDQVLAQDPRHPEALAYRGWLIRLAGDTEQGMELIETALAADPQYPDAHLFKGVILLEDLRQPELAAASLREFLRLDPDSDLAADARGTLTQAEAAAASEA